VSVKAIIEGGGGAVRGSHTSQNLCLWITDILKGCFTSYFFDDMISQGSFAIEANEKCHSSKK